MDKIYGKIASGGPGVRCIDCEKLLEERAFMWQADYYCWQCYKALIEKLNTE